MVLREPKSLNDQNGLKELGVKKESAQEIEEAVIEKFRPKKITIKGEIRLKTYHSNGLQ
ncbi:MAG: hypothetical protein UU74_C0010G0001, partial [Candidatus Woesebacteria bacterium GW2011_GWA1_41_7]